jgi:IclR helix-turn-helix domain
MARRRELEMTYKAERRIIAETFLELVGIIRSSVLPFRRGGEYVGSRAGTIMMVGMAVALGHADNRPLNVSMIARMINIPRSTVLRALEVLIRERHVERIGSAFCLSVERAVPADEDLLTKYIREAKRIARKMSKLDTM